MIKNIYQKCVPDYAVAERIDIKMLSSVVLMSRDFNYLICTVPYLRLV
jgi:hypothetical protein